VGVKVKLDEGLEMFTVMSHDEISPDDKGPVSPPVVMVPLMLPPVRVGVERL